MKTTYHHLLSLGKVIARVAVELHLAQGSDRHQFLRNDLGWVEQVETEAQLVLFFHDLDAELCIID